VKRAYRGGCHCGVSVACLDDASVDELIAAPVRYSDGLNNDWGSTHRETRHL
jgi:hypothetical protein